MHSYCKTDDGKGWQAGYQTDEPRFYPLGPKFDDEWEAAAFASFLNGGRYCPDEIEPIFPKEYPPVEADEEPEDHTTPPSKGNFADYPHEAVQRHK